VIRRLAIVGVGLLGGSAAKAARAEGLAREIVGIGRDAGRLGPPLREGVLDRATTELEDGVRDADFVLLAAPVLASEGLLARVWRAAPEGAVVTDVGSTKRGIVRAAERLAAERRAVAFCGSHPMAGSERSGYGVARADLFRGATVIVTPTDRTEPRAVKAVSELWEALGARVRALDPESHDRVVAAISHLPHAVAYALVTTCSSSPPSPSDRRRSTYCPRVAVELFVAKYTCQPARRRRSSVSRAYGSTCHAIENAVPPSSTTCIPPTTTHDNPDDTMPIVMRRSAVIS